MDALAGYLDRVGMDASDLDEAIADYIIELAREGGTEEETWSVLEGCYPELEESAPSREAFSKTFEQLRQPDATPDTPAKPPPTNGDPALPGKLNGKPGGDTTDGSATERGRATLGGGGSDPGVGSCREEADVDFLREMMPNVSDRGLRHALYRVAKGSRLAAASYLADRCAAGGASSPALRALEADAEAWEQKELLRAAEDSRKAEEAARKVEEGRRRDKAERDALKGCIVGRYADEAEGSLAKMVVPSLTEKKKSTRYRDGKVVTTTGAKVIVETVKPEWDGGSRGKVKTKGKRGKGFV